MLLYLLRHAEAEQEASSDSARRLTKHGQEQARKVARFLEAHGLTLSLVLTSPFRRAHETAEVVASDLRAELLVQTWLASGMQPETALAELQAFRSQSSVLLVGHEPDLSQFAALLLGLGGASQIHVRKASLHAFDLPMLRAGAARLEFSIPCKMM